MTKTSSKFSGKPKCHNLENPELVVQNRQTGDLKFFNIGPFEGFQTSILAGMYIQSRNKDQSDAKLERIESHSNNTVCTHHIFQLNVRCWAIL